MSTASDLNVAKFRRNPPLRLPLSYRDPGSGCEIVVTSPDAAPRLWSEYVAGALSSYRAHGVERALDYEAMRDGRSSSLLFAVLDSSGTVIGGTRSQGLYERAEESHAYLEWGDHPGRTALVAALERMIPEGLAEPKTAWVADGLPFRRDLVACLCRAPIHATGILGARFGIGTAAAFSMPGWLRAGAQVDHDVPMVAYPDERYLTRLIVWDRAVLFDLIEEDQRAAFAEEAVQLGLPPVPPRVPTQHRRSPATSVAEAPSRLGDR